jgi:hypothetical protein
MTRRTAAGLAIVFVVLGSSADGASAGRALHAVASLQPAAVLFGDPVTADVEVDYDPRAVEPSSIRVQPDFVPYVASVAPVVQNIHTGAVRFRYSLLCVTDGCLPTKSSRILQLHAVTVTGLAGTQRLTATAQWPVLRISSRLAAADLGGSVRFRHPTVPPPLEYRVAPGAFAGGLIAAAALCALLAAALVGRELARRSGRAQLLTPLELAIAYVRDSTGRTDPDRRRALALLAAAVDGELATAAAETAWSKPPPTPAGATELADRAAHAGSGGQ